VVQGELQQVLPGVQRHQQRAHERARGQVEGPRGLGGQGLVRRRAALRGRHVRQVHPPQLQALRRDDERARPAVGHRDDRAQRLVPLDQRRQAALERAGVQRAAQAQRRRHVVAGALRVELLQEPEALLLEGERRRTRVDARDERRQRRSRRAAAQRLDAARETGDRRRREDVGQRQLDLEGVAQAANEARRQQRVAAQLEEVVVRTDAAHAEHAGQQLRHERLHRTLRRDTRPLARGVVGVRCGQRAAVDLPHRCAREGGQAHEGGGDQTLGQPRPQQLAQCGGRRQLGASRDEVGHETLVARPVLAQHDERLGHVRVARQRLLDLARLDAHAAQLELLVEPAEVLERAVGAPAHAVAGAVAARAARGRAHEALGGELGAAQVALRHARPADVQLAGHADRDRLPVLVEYGELDVADRSAHVHAPLARPHLAHRRVDRGLGRAVAVPDRAAALEQLRREPPVPGLAAEHGLQAAVARPAGVEQHAEGRRRRLQHRRAGLRQAPRERVAVGGLGARDDLEPRADAQRQEDLEHRDVEGQRRDRQQHVAAVEPRRAAQRGEQVDRRAVADLDALGPAGRARGVDHVGRVVGPRGSRGVDRRGPRRIRRFVRLVEAQHARLAVRQPRGERRGREQHRGARVLEHEGHALGGIGRIDRHVGRARLQHAQQRDDHARIALERDSHQVACADAERGEPAGQLGGLRGELGVAQAPGAHRDGVRRGRARGLRRHEVVHAAIGRSRHRGAAPALELGALAGR
jgi:hypothetical protein